MIKPYRKSTGEVTSWKFIKEFYNRFLAHKYSYETYKTMIKNGNDGCFGIKEV